MSDPSAMTHADLVAEVLRLRAQTDGMSATGPRPVEAGVPIAEQAALLNTIINNAPIGIAFLDLDLRYRQLNAELAALNRRTVAEHLGRSVSEMLPKEGLYLETLLRQVIATGQPILNLELHGERPDEPGLPQVWQASYYPVRDDDGATLGVGLLIAEITAQRQAALLRERHRRELEAIVETLEEGVLAVYRDGDIALINSAARRLCELPAAARPHTWEELLALSPLEIVDEAGVAVGPEACSLARILHGKCFTSLRLCLRRIGQGELRWLSLNGTQVYDERGDLILTVMTARDISRQHSDEAALRAHAEALSRTNADLARALRLKDEFLAMMSHELRTPLAAVLGITEALDEGVYGPLSAGQQGALNTVAQSGRHLLALISDILDLARIGAGADSLDLTFVEVATLCSTVTQLVAVGAQQKGVRILTAIQPGVAGLCADERRLTQILLNLLDNAVKFSPAGGTVGLEVSLDVAHDQICFLVWDKGIGIGDADIGRVFEPFTQLDTRLSRRYGGIGLGLTLVQRLVELHGGSVSVESAPGEGSRFLVKLPWAAEHLATPAPEATAPAPRRPPADRGRPLHVVIADDHEPTLSLYAELMQQQGWQVATARTGHEAIAKVRTHMPDVAVLDIQMPGMDGLEAIRRIRADPALGHVPLIALTALAMPGDRERSLAAGARAYLTKPVSLRTLRETIVAVLPPLDGQPMAP